MSRLVPQKSLCGNWREKHLFTLAQSRQFHRFYQEQIVICETHIERLLQEFAPQACLGSSTTQD
jgi:hypothetical protein